MSYACLKCHGAGWITPPSDKAKLSTLRVYFVPCPECCNGFVSEEHHKIQTEDAQRESRDNGQFGVGA